ncbi:MAG: pilus assembly protein [Hyphomicrobiaceae bacterium]|nr:pilus assembly protein [Hyphomicrobiaceae bacterium]
MLKKASKNIAKSALAQLVHRLKRNDKGVAALEFALIAPFMLTLYMGSIELHHALSADRRVTDLAGATADLVAQSSDISGKMDNIFDAASNYLKPYGVAALRITVVSICHDKDNLGKVDWSAQYNGGVHAYAHEDPIDLPLDDDGNPVLTIKGTSLILTEVTYDYTSPLGRYVYNTTLADHYYLRPRLKETPSVINTDADGAPEGCAADEFMSES